MVASSSFFLLRRQAQWVAEHGAEERRAAAEADASALLRAKHIKQGLAAARRRALKDRARGITGGAHHESWEEEGEDEISVAIYTRAKHTTSRTAEEKAWVALDLLAHPASYSHVTEAEAEEMKHDKGYHVWLDERTGRLSVGADDVRRITALPRAVNLALPFLFTQAEVEWHRLILKFTHGQDPAHYRDADAQVPQGGAARTPWSPLGSLRAGG